MQPVPLDIGHIFSRAEQQFRSKRIIGGESDGVGQISVGEWAARVRKLAGVLDLLAVPDGALVATFGYNSQRHLELYFAVPCAGRVLHTLNIRLSNDQLRFILTAAEDDIVFIDRSLFRQLWPLADSVPGVRLWVVLEDGSDAPLPRDSRVFLYDELLAASTAVEGVFAVDDENRAAAVCFTSGTTGNPKGVVYSHRSTVLHALVSMAAGLLGISERDTVMPIVPMFHASAWGLPYSAVFAGANLVLPGSNMDPRALLAQIEAHRVTVASAVPAIWATMLPHVADFDLSSLRAVFGGGSATPPRLAANWLEAVGVPITHTWGMTELSPTGAVGGLRSTHDDATDDVRSRISAAQGQAIPLVELRIVDVASGTRQPHDGVSVGELQAHGPTVAAGYLGVVDSASSMTEDGWIRTGDIASIDEEGYLTIRDRIKDLIKSGGEWIPSLQLESAILVNDAIAEVAVVGRSDARWSERPVAFVVLKAGHRLDADAVLDALRPLVAKWWLPDEIYFVTELPRTGTGKVAKNVLRDRVAD